MTLRHDIAPPSLCAAGVEVRERAPYSILASLYDTLMWHVDYVKWADYLIRISERFKVPSGVWCEGGCGTGSIALRIARFKHQVCGFDQSAEMVEAAKKKAEEHSFHIPFDVADFRNFSYNNLAYLFVVYDGLNYLLELSELEQFLANASASLQPDGLLVFDMCTEHNSVSNLNDWFDHYKRNGVEYRRHSWFDAERSLHHNDFEVRRDDEPNIVYIENHVQRIYPLDEMKKLIARSDFRLVVTLGDVGFSPGTEHNDRVHFIVRKK